MMTSLAPRLVAQNDFNSYDLFKYSYLYPLSIGNKWSTHIVKII